MILTDSLKKFIKEHAGEDVQQVLLKYAKDFPQEIRLIAQQIEGIQKAKSKVPFLLDNEDILYPPRVSMEQCSSQWTAAYKASLFSGKTIIDITGGLGIDCIALADRFQEVIHVEASAALQAIAAHNFQVLGKKNITSFCQDGLNFLKNNDQKLDLIYLDPSRRVAGSKVFKLKDCEPNPIEHMDLFKSRTDKLLIKISPLMDISAAIKEVPAITKVHVLALDNECKELLLEIDFTRIAREPQIIAVNLERIEESDKQLAFYPSEEELANPGYSKVLKYLYEPNAAIMKSGAYKRVAEVYSLLKLHVHSHLYTSDILVEDFPGRKFAVRHIHDYNKSGIREIAVLGKANVSARNFPLSVESIRKKTKLKDGGEAYLFATTDKDGSLVIIECNKLS